MLCTLLMVGPIMMHGNARYVVLVDVIQTIRC